MRRADANARRVAAAFGVLAFSAIFLQKFGLPLPGASGAISLDFLVLWGVLLWLLLQGSAVVDTVRLVLFIVMLCSAILALVLEQGIYSLPALILFLSTYSAVVVRIDVDKATLLRCLNRYQTAMLWIAGIVLVQQGVQFTIGAGYWPNLNALLPESILLGGFAYLRPYDWPPEYFMPNAVFFLEPSAVSLFLAISLAVEIIWFKRIVRVLVLASTLFAAMIGTGILITAALSPLLLRHMTRKLRIWAISLAIPLLVVASVIGATSYLSGRTGELSSKDSSAYGRIIAPFERSIKLLSSPSYLFTGDGPGSSPKEPVQWPADKISYEYGNLTMVAFHIFIFVAVVATAANRTVAVAALIPNLFFGGGFGLASDVMIMIMFGSLLQAKATDEAISLRSEAYLHESIPEIA